MFGTCVNSALSIILFHQTGNVFMDPLLHSFLAILFQKWFPHLEWHNPTRYYSTHFAI